MKPFNDEQLMQLFCSGDRDAFQELFHKYKDKIYRFIHSIYIKNRTLAEDCTQEVFIKVIRNKDRFDHTMRFSTWLYTIARNHCLNQIRHSRIIDLKQDELKETLQDMQNKNPVDKIEDGELRKTVQNAIYELPENLKTVFILREIEILPYAQIADILDMQEGNVRIQLHRAKKILRNKLSPYVEGTDEY